MYGLAGVGLVVTYKTTGVLNFGYGAFATIGAYVYYWLYVDQGLAWPYALALTVLVVGPLLGLLYELLARKLIRVSVVLQIAATVGIILIVTAVAALWYGRSGDLFPSYFPTTTIKLGGVYVGWDQIIVALVALSTTMVLYLFFKRSRVGAAMRAVVDNADLLDLGGISPVTVRRWACVIGCSFAVLSGALIAPSLNLDAFVLTLLVVQSFGAAAIGYFSNLPLTYTGGLMIGVVAALATKYSIDYTWLTGLPASVPFIALFLVLVLMPRALLVDRRSTRPRPRRVRRAAAPVRSRWESCC